MSSDTKILGKSNQSKNLISYSIIGIIFLVALWLSSQSEGPSKFPKFVTENPPLGGHFPWSWWSPTAVPL